MQAHRRWRLVAGIVACVSLLAACNGDDGPKVSTQPTTTTVEVSGSTTTTTRECSVPGATVDPKTGTGATTISLLTDVRTGRQPCADRVVFDFRDGSRPTYSVEYRPGPTFALGQSDQTTTVEGNAFLVIRFDAASGVDLSGPQFVETYTGPASIRPSGLTHVTEIRRIEDFEAVLVWVIGLDASRPFTVGALDGPPRIYVDIA